MLCHTTSLLRDPCYNNWVTDHHSENFSKHVSFEFDKFGVGAHLYKLRDTPADRLLWLHTACRKQRLYKTTPMSWLMRWRVCCCRCKNYKQLKASLAEQLSVDQLRTEFRSYIKTKVAQELVDFYLDSLDREEVKDFFERQVRHSFIRGCAGSIPGVPKWIFIMRGHVGFTPGFPRYSCLRTVCGKRLEIYPRDIYGIPSSGTAFEVTEALFVLDSAAVCRPPI